MLICENLFCFYSYAMGIITNQLKLRKNTNTWSIFNSLHCSYNKKLNTTKMPNNKSYKLMPNEKRDYNTGVSDGIKKF